jgi:hypothetical protein
MAIFSETLEQDLKDLSMSINYADTSDFMNENPLKENVDEIVIYDYNDFFDMKTFRVPKTKMVDIEWVMNKYNNNKVYQSFASNFKKLLETKGYRNSINVYPTTYGIGVFVAFGRREDLLEMKNNIDELMSSLGVEYKNQSSDAGWVFRYVISKKKENISKMELI